MRLFLIVAFIFGFSSLLWIRGILDDEPVACIMDVKQCSDGSYVSRTGPYCEFAQCPK